MASLPPLLLIGTGLILLGELLHIIGLATPHWEEMDGGIIHGYQGLFKYCFKDNCDTFEDLTSAGEATQAMVIIGMLLGLLAAATVLVYVIFNFMSKSAPKMLTLVCTAAAIAACIFIIVGVIIYADKIHTDEFDYGYSFALCIVGSILLAVGGVLVFVGGKSIG